MAVSKPGSNISLNGDLLGEKGCLLKGYLVVCKAS